MLLEGRRERLRTDSFQSQMPENQKATWHLTQQPNTQKKGDSDFPDKKAFKTTRGKQKHEKRKKKITSDNTQPPQQRTTLPTYPTSAIQMCDRENTQTLKREKEQKRLSEVSQ